MIKSCNNNFFKFMFVLKNFVYNLLFANNFVNIKLYKIFTDHGDAWQSEDQL